MLVALLLTGLSSCKKGDDFYISPNAPLAATPATMLAACEVGTFNNLEGYTVKIASIWMQNSSGVLNYAIQIEQYAPTESDMDYVWNPLYLNMNNCKQIADLYGAKDPYYRGISSVLMAMNLGLATDMWGDVPFSEAFQGASISFTPHFDPQQAVLSSIQTLLDNAITDLATDVSANQDLPGADDFVFGGNTSSWTKVAWTLKARYYNRLSKKAGYDANIVRTYLANGITSNADNCYAKHGNGGNESNDWAAYINSRGYIVSSQVLIDSMGNMADPRTPCYYDTISNGGGAPGTAVGNPLGDLNSDVSYWGPYLGGIVDVAGNTNPAKNIVLVSYAEAKFLEAEAKVRLADATAFTSLNEAIMADVSEVTQGANTGSSIATYTATNTTVHTVILEKWKAMFANPVESYSDYRRTGFPMLTPNPNSLLTHIPTRLPTSQQERISNPNAPTPSLDTPVWYAQ